MSTASRRVEDISLVFIRLDVNDKNALFFRFADGYEDGFKSNTETNLKDHRERSCSS